ncbi:MAG: PglZ domain-containing protein [Anaerolineae bacterium]
MALVTETLINCLRKQVEVHGTVVWYDPKQDYLDLAESLAPETVAGAAVHCYDPERGFIWLRRELEPLWEKRTAPPRLIICVPLSQAETHHALIEFEVAGVVVQPGQQPPEQNTALATIARQALATVFPPARLAEIVAQVKAGQLSLAELDQMAEKGIVELTGVVAVVFGSDNIDEIALRFLASSELDATIETRQALGSLAGLLARALGVDLPADQGPAALRAQLARQVLLTDFIEALGDSVPQALRTFPVAPSAVARQAAVNLAQAWRQRRDLAESYVHWAGRIQTEIGLGPLDLDLAVLARAETFAGGEVQLQAEVEKALAHRPSERLVELAVARCEGFWSTQKPEIKTRWEVISDAGQVLVEAARVESALKGKAWPAGSLLSNYVHGDAPWCTLDAAQRHLERDYHRFDLDPQQHDSLIQLVARARQRYAAVSNDLAERFTRAYATDKFELPIASVPAGSPDPAVMIQTDIYREVVAPASKNGPVAYILVDALRFEMAREALSILEAAWSHELMPALATPPTITEIGMAALLPGAENGLTVVSAGGSKLAAIVAGKTLKTRQERLDHFRTAVDGPVAVARLDQLAPLSDIHLSKALKSAEVVLITATEQIDTLCETNPSLARRMLDDVLNQLRRGIKSLFGLGVQTVIITADHGYLFGEKLTSGQGIDAPGGDTTTLKRRVWVGRGGAGAPEAVLRRPLSAFGIGGDLEIATPWNLSCFKVPGGSTDYFHGGLSLPELVIPVLVVHAGAVPAPAAGAQVQWTLTLGSPTVSTRFLSVTIEGRSQELLPIEAPAVRVEVRARNQPISAPVSASYGFQEATKDVQLELEAGAPQSIAQNTVTLMITETPAVDEVTVHLLDATTGVSLARLDHVPFAIVL